MQTGRPGEEGTRPLNDARTDDATRLCHALRAIRAVASDALTDTSDDALRAVHAIAADALTTIHPVLAQDCAHRTLRALG